MCVIHLLNLHHGDALRLGLDLLSLVLPTRFPISLLRDWRSERRYRIWAAGLAAEE